MGKPDAARVDGEASIVAAIKAGDTAGALELLMSAYGTEIYGFCARTLRDRDLAEDVLQETLTQVYRDLAGWQQRSSLRTWLFGVARHRCLDAIKSRRRKEQRLVHDDRADVADARPDPNDRAEAAERAQALEDCLAALPDHVRAAVLMRFGEGTSYEELAVMCAEKSDTVRARVVRAMPQLRDCMRRKGFDS